jgi:hypothetical protein
MAVFWAVAICSPMITLMKEAANTSETSTNTCHTTWPRRTEESYLYSQTWIIFLDNSFNCSVYCYTYNNWFIISTKIAFHSTISLQTGEILGFILDETSDSKKILPTDSVSVTGLRLKYRLKTHATHIKVFTGRCNSIQFDWTNKH